MYPYTEKVDQMASVRKGVWQRLAGIGTEKFRSVYWEEKYCGRINLAGGNVGCGSQPSRTPMIKHAKTERKRKREREREKEDEQDKERRREDELEKSEVD